MTVHPQRTRTRRRTRIPKPVLQLRLSWGFLGVAALALLVQSLYFGLLLVRLSASLPAGGDEVAEQAGDLVFQVLLFSFLVILPLVLLIGVHVTFRIAGPIYRFEQHLGAVARGERPGECRIRKGDYLQKLCSLINAGLEAARQEPGEPRRDTTVARRSA